MIPNKKDAALLLRVVEEIWNQGNVDLADELFSSDYVNHGGLIPDLVKGPEGVKFSVALYRAAYPDLRIRVDSLSSIAGTVNVRWTAKSTSNPGHEFCGAIKSSIAGGQVVESWTSWDSTAVLLGLAPPVHEETS